MNELERLRAKVERLEYENKQLLRANMTEEEQIAEQEYNQECEIYGDPYHEEYLSSGRSEADGRAESWDWLKNEC